MNTALLTNNTISQIQLPLRDYQQESVDQIFTHWFNHKNILVQQPTGAGKKQGAGSREQGVGRKMQRYV